MSLLKFFGAPRAGAAPPPAAIRKPVAVYEPDVDLASLPQDFWQPVPRDEFLTVVDSLRWSLSAICERGPFGEGTGDSASASGAADGGGGDLVVAYRGAAWLACASGSARSVYSLHTRSLLQQTVLGSYAHLFSPREVALARVLIALPPRALGLVARVFNRKGPWVKLSSCEDYTELADEAVTWSDDEDTTSVGASANSSAVTNASPGVGVDVGTGAGACAGAAVGAAGSAELTDDEASEAGVDEIEGGRGTPMPLLVGSGTASLLRGIPRRPRARRERGDFTRVQAVATALAQDGLLDVFPVPRSIRAVNATPAARSRAARLALAAVTSCASVEQLRAVAASLRVNVVRAVTPLPGGDSGTGAQQQQQQQTFSATTVLATPTAPTRADIVAALYSAVASQKTLFGVPLPFEARATDVLGNGRIAFFRLAPRLTTLLRRAHALFYIVTATAHVSSGLGTGSWPIHDDDGDEEASDEEGYGCGEPRESATAPADSPPPLGDDDLDASGPPPLGDSSQAQQGGDSGEDVIELLSDDDDATPSPPRGQPSLLFSSEAAPQVRSDRVKQHAASAPVRPSSWVAASGSKYSDHIAVSREAFVPSPGDGGVPFSPALQAVFRRVDFCSTPHGASFSPRALLSSRDDLALLEAAHMFRAAVDAGGALATPPACALPPTAPAAAAATRHNRFTRALEFSWGDATGASAGTAADGTESVTETLTAMPNAAWPPIAAGLGLLPFAAQLLGAPAPSTRTRATTSFSAAARAGITAALAIPPSVIPVGTSSPRGSTGARALARVLQVYATRAAAAADAMVVLPPPAGAASAMCSALLSAPALGVALRASLALALTLPAASAVPQTLRGLTPAALFATILYESVDPLERARAYAHAVPLLFQLATACERVLPHASGRCWVRLAIDLEHLSLLGDARAVVGVALSRRNVRGGARLALETRAARLDRRATGPAGGELLELDENGNEAADDHAYADAMPLLAEIRAATGGAPASRYGMLGADSFVRTALNRRVGEKSRFVADADSDNDGDESAGEALPRALALTDAVCASFGVAWPGGPWDFRIPGGAAAVGSRSLRVNVEGAALEHYASLGWRGVHCEGDLLRALCALLLWEVVWSAPAPPNVFLTPFQDAPLDLDVPGSFHAPARLPSLRARLMTIAKSSSAELRLDVANTWRAHAGQAARSVRWERAPLALLQLIATGIGGPTLAALCDAFVADFKGVSGGLPDLLLWRIDTASALAHAQFPRGTGSLSDELPELPPDAFVSVRFVEVKGGTDVLSDRQRVWLRVLLEAGADVGVCKVTT